MKAALSEAEKALKEKEVPVGAVIVKENEIISTGYNKREAMKNALCHAEIEAIDKACKKLSSRVLDDCTLYVTLEPCPMCTGAVINARIGKVVYGAYDEKGGCMGSLCNLCELPFNHKPKVIGGYMEKECSEILTDFFKKFRSDKS